MTISKIIACGHAPSETDLHTRTFAAVEAITECSLPFGADAWADVRIENAHPWLRATAFFPRVELVEARHEHGNRST
jgi:hypothetical protein